MEAGYRQRCAVPLRAKSLRSESGILPRIPSTMPWATDAGGSGIELPELGAGGVGDDFPEGGLARAGRAVKDRAGEAVVFQRSSMSCSSSTPSL